MCFWTRQNILLCLWGEQTLRSIQLICVGASLKIASKASKQKQANLGTICDKEFTAPCCSRTQHRRATSHLDMSAEPNEYHKRKKVMDWGHCTPEVLFNFQLVNRVK